MEEDQDGIFRVREGLGGLAGETGSKAHIVKCTHLAFKMGNLTETLKGPRGGSGACRERGIQNHYRLNAPTT